MDSCTTGCDAAGESGNNGHHRGHKTAGYNNKLMVATLIGDHIWVVLLLGNAVELLSLTLQVLPGIAMVFTCYKAMALYSRVYIYQF